LGVGGGVGVAAWDGVGVACVVGATTGVTGLAGGAAGRVGGFGMYSGPVWPQPVTVTASAAATMSA